MRRSLVLVCAALLLAGCGIRPAVLQTLVPAVQRSPTPRSTPTHPPATAVPASPTAAPTFSTAVPPVATLKLAANVRAGPGTGYPVIGRLKSGSRYPILGKSEDSTWWQIQIDDRMGWIPADFTDVQGGKSVVRVVPLGPASTPTVPPTRVAGRATSVPEATPTALPAPTGRIYFIIQGHVAWLRPRVLDQIFQDVTLGAPGDLGPSLNTNASPLDWSERAGKMAYVVSGQQDTLHISNASGDRALESHGAISTPRWFGDGAQIAFVGYDNSYQTQAIYVINTDGTKPPNYRCFPARGGEQLRGLAVNKRTGDVVFVSNYSGSFELWKMDRSCRNAAQLTHDNADDSAPAFSPDGSQLAYVSNQSGPTDYQIYLTSAAANGASPVALGEGFTPAFSPDGLYLAFARNLEVYMMDADGNNALPLTPGDRPIWTP